MDQYLLVSHWCAGLQTRVYLVHATLKLHQCRQLNCLPNWEIEPTGLSTSRQTWKSLSRQIQLFAIITQTRVTPYFHRLSVAFTESESVVIWYVLIPQDFEQEWWDDHEPEEEWMDQPQWLDVVSDVPFPTVTFTKYLQCGSLCWTFLPH